MAKDRRDEAYRTAGRGWGFNGVQIVLDEELLQSVGGVLGGLPADCPDGVEGRRWGSYAHPSVDEAFQSIGEFSGDIWGVKVAC